MNVLYCNNKVHVTLLFFGFVCVGSVVREQDKLLLSEHEFGNSLRIVVPLHLEFDMKKNNYLLDYMNHDLVSGNVSNIHEFVDSWKLQGSDYSVKQIKDLEESLIYDFLHFVPFFGWSDIYWSDVLFIRFDNIGKYGIAMYWSEYQGLCFGAVLFAR